MTRHICLLLPKCYWQEAYQYHSHNKLPTTSISFCKNLPGNNELSTFSAFVSFSVPSGTLIMHILFIFMAFCKSWRLFIPFSTQENSEHFIFIYQKIIPWKKKIHSTDTEKKSEHVMSNYFKKHISKPKANLFFF